MTDTDAWYAANAETFFADTVGSAAERMFAAFLPFLPAGGRILDAGCGSGRDAKAFLERGFAVEAFDASPQLARLASRHAGIEVKVMRFSDVAWTDEFDGIWACASLLHVPRADLPATVRRLVGALKPGGVICASFKEGEAEREKGGRRFTDMTEAMLAALFEEAGLCVLETWRGLDQRPGREGEGWVSATGRRLG